MTPEIKNRIKSFIWRTGAMTFVAVAAYVTGLGDIYLIDWKLLTNIAVITIIGLIVAEITKYFNTK